MSTKSAIKAQQMLCAWHPPVATLCLQGLKIAHSLLYY